MLFWTRRAISRFQSTLPRRERPAKMVGNAVTKKFQSTLPRRERPDPCQRARRRDHISIHAPAKGATPRAAAQLWHWPFQSTLPRRERLCHGQHAAVFDIFQSTLPRRERPIRSGSMLDWVQHFNPRSREGSDYDRLYSITYHINFNPRSREGSDCFLNLRCVSDDNISIHAPAKGATIISPKVI